ncbi:MAG: RES domain-containing protein [Flavobacterium psychrophilum]|nr:MAG: RES domain-containing protein [Flavobacterium psychrophilum]
MGQVKQQWLKHQELHLSSIPDKKVCVRHFEDKAINNFIRRNYQPGYCDYCNKEVNVVALEEVLVFMMEGIGNYYEDAANFMGYDSREGGYIGDTYTADELIQEQIELVTDPFELTEDIVAAIEEIAWAEPDRYYDSERDELMYHWSYFKDIIKHKARYLFTSYGAKDSQENDAFRILSEVGRISKGFNLVHKINKGQKIYRCRQHHLSRKFTDAKDLVAPPSDYAIYPNRFSPSGISMLYAAFDKETAIRETISRENKKANRITVSEFIIDKDIYIIDFNKLPLLPSIFQHKSVKSYYLIAFLYDLVRDFTKDITKDGKEHTEYVPTQVVTEFFRYTFNRNRKNKIEGIIYPSSKNKPNSSAVLFWDNEECLRNLKLERISTIKTTRYLSH